MATVSLKNVKKIYDNKVTAVHDFNLEIADKEFIVLVGPSGCGKSTTLRMIAGLEDISEGDLVIGGKRMNDVEPKDRDIAMVFQSYALYPHMTVYENMAFALKLRKVPKEEIDKKVREAAEILDITQYLDRKDEPLSNLDAKLRNQMRAEIIKLRQRINTTFIYVTHDQTEAMTLGDRIVIMKDGFIQQIGTPQEVFDQPANLFVAGFIGSPQMNFFDGELEKKDGKYQLKVGEATVVLGGKAQELLAGKGVGERKVTVGIRPEHIAFAAAPGTDTVSSKVDVSEMMGSEVYLHVNAVGRDVVLRIPTTDLPAEHRAGIPYGTEINFAFRPELIHLFDPETEKNLMY